MNRFIYFAAFLVVIGALALGGCKGKVDEAALLETQGLESVETTMEGPASMAAPGAEESVAPIPITQETTVTMGAETIVAGAEVIKPTTQQIQAALKSAGFYTGAIDGIAGKQTKAAIKEFQKANGLAVDGVVGQKTWGKLKAYLSQ